jgi:hypothetical protein
MNFPMLAQIILTSQSHSVSQEHQCSTHTKHGE